MRITDSLYMKTPDDGQQKIVLKEIAPRVKGKSIIIETAIEEGGEVIEIEGIVIGDNLITKTDEIFPPHTRVLGIIKMPT